MIVVAVLVLRFNLSYREVEDQPVERGVDIDRVSMYRWLQQFIPLLADATRFSRRAPGATPEPFHLTL